MDYETKQKIIDKILKRVPANYCLPSKDEWKWEQEGDEITVMIRMNNRSRGDLWFSWNQKIEKKNDLFKDWNF